jgi:hypothetical protein
MAQYKCIPMYEYIRPGIYVLFNGNGDYSTNDEKVIAALSEAAPFIQRIDVEEAEDNAEQTETKPQTKRK